MTRKQNQIYRMYDEADRLMYVGISADVANRLTQHRHDKFWWPEVVTIRIANCGDRESALLAEKTAIENEAPFFNLVHNRHCMRCLAEGENIHYRIGDTTFRFCPSCNPRFAHKFKPTERVR